MRNELVLYHNPRCGKSRGALSILLSSDHKYRIVEYLKTPPTAPEIRELVRKTGLPANQLLRKGEDIYKQLFPKGVPSEEEAVDAMTRYPILIERPILVDGDRALVARPPELIHDFLKNS